MALRSIVEYVLSTLSFHSAASARANQFGNNVTNFSSYRGSEIASVARSLRHTATGVETIVVASS